jgi:hypothetical protein
MVGMIKETGREGRLSCEEDKREGEGVGLIMRASTVDPGWKDKGGQNMANECRGC